MRTWNYIFYSTTAVQQRTAFSTSALGIEYTTACAIQAVCTGTPNGTLSLSSSNDGSNFTEIANSQFAATTATSYTWNLLDPGFFYVRGNFLGGASSSGQLTFRMNSKGF